MVRSVCIKATAWFYILSFSVSIVMSSSHQRIGFTSLTTYFRKCFLSFGLWFDTNHVSKWNRLHTFVTCLFYFVYLICLITYLFFTTDLEDTVNAMYMAMTILSLFVKVINFVLKNRAIRMCLDHVHDFELLSDVERSLYHKRHTHFARLMIYYYTVCYITATASGINAAFHATLPFRGSYPCDWRHGGSCYWSVYTFQMIGICFCVQLNVALEQFTCFLMYEISVQLEILGHRLSDIGWKVHIKNQQNADLRIWVKEHTKSMQWVVMYIIILLIYMFNFCITG